jgi:hypothetical protein
MLYKSIKTWQGTNTLAYLSAWSRGKIGDKRFIIFAPYKSILDEWDSWEGKNILLLNEKKKMTLSST